MYYKELAESEAIQREEALVRIAALIQRYDIRPADLWALFPDQSVNQPLGQSRAESKLFDPFFDA